VTKDPGAVLRVYWGYDVDVELVVSKLNWSKILRGKEVRLRGKGYYYEGEFFRDYWYFFGGFDGELRVSYSGGGDGFIGTPREALVEHYLDKPLPPNT
jgi:hypothetical protein